MGNTGSSGGGGGTGRRRNHHHQHHAPSILPPPAPQQQQPAPSPEVSAGNHFAFAAATPYPQYPNPNSQQYYQYVGSYPHPPAMPSQIPAPFDHYQRSGGDHPAYHQGWATAPRYSYGPTPPQPMPLVEHQKAVTIRNDVNLKKETLRIEPDEENPGTYLVAFTFDATVSGSITVLFFAKEGLDCNLVPTKDGLPAPVTVSFKDGLGQKFKQSAGTGIDFSLFQEAELIKEGETDVYPLVVKAEACPADQQGLGKSHGAVTPNSQITQAVFGKKESGEHHVRVAKQILWVNGTRYELQEIYGIGNSVDGDFDGNDPGKECVICLSELRDTTVLPCRHMCMCSGCAKFLRYQTNRCPICRQPVERLLEIKVSNRGVDDQQNSGTAEPTAERSGEQQ